MNQRVDWLQLVLWSLAFSMVCQAAEAGPAALTSPASLPQWAQPGMYHSARWDGGPIEAEKGRLSGWPGFEADDRTGILTATRGWYDPRTIEFLKIAGINWTWVTWSVGFSHETESRQWEQLRTYVAECHRNGIRVAAYLSIANMFWQDMFRFHPASRGWVDLLANGSPRYYSFPHRYMARISDPGWLEYVRKRVRAALDADVDSFWIDNTFVYHGAGNVQRFLTLLHAEAAGRGRQVVIQSNYNRGIYTWARFQNGVTTEDGKEPGYYPDDPAGQRLVTNAGLLRYHFAIAEGWRPVSVEYGSRRQGERFTSPMQPNKWQLSLAECAAFQASFTPFFEGVFLRGLYRGEAKSIEALQAIGRYNLFFEKHKQYYAQSQSLAQVAVLSDTNDRVVPLLNQLAGRNIQFDVRFNYQQLSARDLAAYRVVVLPNTNPVPAGLCSALHVFARSGGTLIVIQDAGFFGSTSGNCLPELLGISPQRLPNSRTAVRIARGSGIYYPVPPSAAELAAELDALVRDHAPVSVTVDDGILYNAVRQKSPPRLLLHVLNYRQEKRTGLTVCLAGEVKSVRVLSPDSESPPEAPAQFRNGQSCFALPELSTYSLAVIE